MLINNFFGLTESSKGGRPKTTNIGTPQLLVRENRTHKGCLITNLDLRFSLGLN